MPPIPHPRIARSQAPTPRPVPLPSRANPAPQAGRPDATHKATDFIGKPVLEAIAPRKIRSAARHCATSRSLPLAAKIAGNGSGSRGMGSKPQISGSGLRSTSAGVTSSAPRTCPIRWVATQCATVKQPRLCETNTGGVARVRPGISMVTALTKAAHQGCVKHRRDEVYWRASCAIV